MNDVKLSIDEALTVASEYFKDKFKKYKDNEANDNNQLIVTFKTYNDSDITQSEKNYHLMKLIEGVIQNWNAPNNNIMMYNNKYRNAKAKDYNKLVLPSDNSCCYVSGKNTYSAIDFCKGIAYHYKMIILYFLNANVKNEFLYALILNKDNDVKNVLEERYKVDFESLCSNIYKIINKSLETSFSPNMFNAQIYGRNNDGSYAMLQVVSSAGIAFKHNYININKMNVKNVDGFVKNMCY